MKNISQISIDQEAFELGMKLFNAKHQEESSKLSKRLRYLQNQFTAVRNELTELVKMRTRQELTYEEFMEQKGELLNQKKEIQEKLNDNNSSADSWLELCSKYLKNAFEAKEILEGDDLEEKRDLILDVGQNLILKDEKLQISFKEPYDVLLLPKYRQDMLLGLDSNQNKRIQSPLSYR